MSLQLAEHVHWCDCEGRAVFLDTRADRYFCLPQTANDAFLRTAASRSDARDEAELEMLLKNGMLIESDARTDLRPPPKVTTPTRDLLDEELPRPSRTLILRVLIAELSAAWALKRTSLQMVLEAARLPASMRSSHRASKPSEIAAAAAAVAFITRSHDRCLVRALAVHFLCKENQASSKLVVGVVAHPFAAHCWVQLGSAVVVGGYEQARLYTPILVLE